MYSLKIVMFKRNKLSSFKMRFYFYSFEDITFIYHEAYFLLSS